jgi:hypothetical protein
MKRSGAAAMVLITERQRMCCAEFETPEHHLRTVADAFASVVKAEHPTGISHLSSSI